jgi:predicted acetyltransferase
VSSLRLVLPHFRYKTTYIDAMREFEKEKGFIEWNFWALENDFEGFIQMLREKETQPHQGASPETVFWSMVDDEFVGRISVRHDISFGNLINYGGHIGYDIRPSARNKGYGTEQCRLGLEYAFTMGIERVLITCDDNNIGSIRIIEANGGVLENKVDNNKPVLTRRYWVQKPE